MIFTMLVSIYTSRVVLNTLGIEDYGIYSVVGGVIAMFSFLNTTMAGATQRFLSFEIGRGDEVALNKVFCTSINVHTLIAAIVALLGETIGLWFIYNELVIPPERFDAALWVFQCTVISSVISILCVPLNALIIAHEKMGAFAYLSVLDVVLRLLIVYILAISPFDKLKLYAVLSLAVGLINTSIYVIYCIRYFKEARYHFIHDSALFKSMTGFAGWDMFGNISGIARTQGVSMLLNIFFGPVANAAAGIASTVQSAVMGFSTNVTIAVKPQIIKTYSHGDYDRMFFLINRGCVFTNLLMVMISIPLLIETPYVLELWLGIVPDNAITFCRLTLLFNIISIHSHFLLPGVQATGNIRQASTIMGVVYMLVVPFSYILFKLGCAPWVAFLLNTIFVGIGMLSNAYALHKNIPEYSLSEFGKKVLIPNSATIILFLAVLYMLSGIIDKSFIRFVIICISSVLLAVFLAAILMTKQERSIANKYISKWLRLH